MKTFLFCVPIYMLDPTRSKMKGKTKSKKWGFFFFKSIQQCFPNPFPSKNHQLFSGFSERFRFVHFYEGRNGKKNPTSTDVRAWIFNFIYWIKFLWGPQITTAASSQEIHPEFINSKNPKRSLLFFKKQHFARVSSFLLQNYEWVCVLLRLPKNPHLPSLGNLCKFGKHCYKGSARLTTILFV